MLRFILILIAVWVAIVAVKRLRGAVSRSGPRLKDQGKMVDCEICGVFLPPQEAYEVEPGRFRCDQHQHDD